MLYHKYGVFAYWVFCLRAVFLYILENLRTDNLKLGYGLSYKELVIMSKYNLRSMGKLASLSSS